MRLTVSELSERLWNTVDRVCKHLLPNGKREANEWCVGSIEGESGKSLKVNLAGKRAWSDFQTGESGDLLDLWVAVRQVPLHDAIREAKEFLGFKDDDQYLVQPQKKYVKPDKKHLRSKRKEHIAYLKSRGLSEETMKAFKVCDCEVLTTTQKKQFRVLPTRTSGERKRFLLSRLVLSETTVKKLLTRPRMQSRDCSAGI